MFFLAWYLFGVGRMYTISPVRAMDGTAVLTGPLSIALHMLYTSLYFVCCVSLVFEKLFTHLAQRV
jgi:hypothetical protein